LHSQLNQDAFHRKVSTRNHTTQNFRRLQKSRNTHNSALSTIANTSRSDIIKIILAIFLPPLGVFLERGCNADFLINILLTVLGYIPGIIHAL